MLLVLHKMTFHENEAAHLCVTMGNRSGGIVGYNMACKVLTQYQGVRNKLL